VHQIAARSKQKILGKELGRDPNSTSPGKTMNLTSQQKALLLAIADGHNASKGKPFIFVHHSSGRGLCYEGGHTAWVDADRSDFVQLRREKLIDFTPQKWPSLTGKPTQFGIDAAVSLRRGIEAGKRTVEDARGVPGPAKDAVSRVPLQDAEPQGHAGTAKMDKADVGQQWTEAPATSRPDLDSGVGEKQERASIGGEVKARLRHGLPGGTDLPEEVKLPLASQLERSRKTIGISDLMSRAGSELLPQHISPEILQALSRIESISAEGYSRIMRIAGTLETREEFISRLPKLLAEMGLKLPPGVLQSPLADRGAKGDMTILRDTNGERKRAVTLDAAKRFGGVTRRTIEAAAQKGTLQTEGKGQQRRVLVESLLKYFPPEK
jgi:hypothetical protein